MHTIEELKKRIMGLQNSLEEINSDMKEVKTKVTNVQDTLEQINNKLDANQRRRTLPQRPDIPPLPDIFYGKDSVVAEAAAALTQTTRRHLALIGQGGIGKTTTARAILHDPRIEHHFTTEIGEVKVIDRRVWVSCIGVDTVEKFERALLTAVGGRMESLNDRQTAINELKNLEGPILVIFDNFETPWDASNVGTEVENILRSLDALPQLSIFVTMRAGEPPCHRLNWHVMSANAVDDGAARSIYLEMRQGPAELSAQEDAALAELLKMVGNHPLAIILLAASGRKKNTTVNAVLSQYKALGTSMLGPSGTDRYHNMDLCIQVSIERLTGNFRDASLHLLARLSMLPAGATMSSFWLEDINDTVSPALDLLIDAALVQTQQLESDGMQRYTIHPVIRDYILDKRRCPHGVFVRLLERARAFLDTNKYNIGEVGFKERAANIRTEETNLQAVLLIPSIEDINDGHIDALLNSLLVLEKHYAATSPSLEVAEKAVSLSKRADKPLLQAEALFALGKNLHELDHFPEAKVSFESARELFKGESGCQPASRAADCLLEILNELSYITTGSFNEKMALVDAAFTEFQSVPDKIGVGRCFREQGGVFSQASRHLDTLKALQEACKLLVDTPYDLGLCYSLQSHTHFKLGNFEEGDRCGKLAIERLGQLGSTADLARSLLEMGNGHNTWGHYQTAVEILNNAIDRYTDCSSSTSSGLAQSWTAMSIALIGMGQMDLAAKAIEEAHKFSSSLPDGQSKMYSLRDCKRLRARLVEAKEKLASIDVIN